MTILVIVNNGMMLAGNGIGFLSRTWFTTGSPNAKADCSLSLMTVGLSLPHWQKLTTTLETLIF